MSNIPSTNETVLEKRETAFNIENGLNIGEFSIAQLNAASPKIIFEIPPYQRGYRWTTTHKNTKGKIEKGEIETLLDDLKEFIETDDWHCYCLQPIVLQKNKDIINHYFVVDGQQRLTTIAIICHALKIDFAEHWDLLYKHEIKSQQDEETILQLSERLRYYDDNPIQKEGEHINDHFRRNAFSAIKEWLEKNKHNQEAFRKLFGASQESNKEIKLIKYILDPETEDKNDSEPGHAAFNRLNSEKIPLTSGELIKALFMAPGNGLTDNDKMEIAKEWEIIEQTLHDKKYWNMFNVHGTAFENTQTRIELLFSIVAKLDGNIIEQAKYDQRLIFSKIEERVKRESKEQTKEQIDEVWKEIVKIFWWIQSCYKNVKIYNLLGWLTLFRNWKPQSVYQLWQSKEKGANQDWEQFITILKKEIDIYKLIKNAKLLENLNINSENELKNRIQNSEEETLKNSIRDQSIYVLSQEFNDSFKRLFVLLNIQSCINKNERFQFSEYTRIHSEGLKKGKIKIAGWDVEHIKPQHTKNDSNQFSAGTLEMNSIANLVLLDRATNEEGCFTSSEHGKGYAKAETYSEKRNIIIQQLKEPGYYMLPITREAILKQYSTKGTSAEIDQWNDNDGNDYFDVVWSLIKNFLGIKDEE